MPQDLPGFYYDAEKNRYFPIKGPIPGSSRASSSSSSSAAAQKPTPKSTRVLGRRTGLRASKLLHLRELFGNIIPFSKGKCSFKEEFQKIQISQPVVVPVPHIRRRSSVQPMGSKGFVRGKTT